MNTRPISERTRRIREAQGDADRLTPEILAKALDDGSAHFVVGEALKPTIFVEVIEGGKSGQLSPHGTAEGDRVWATAKYFLESDDELEVPMYRDGKCIGRYWIVEWVHGDHVCLRRQW